MIARRTFLGGALALAGGGATRAAADLLGADGKPVPTWRLPSEIALDMPGLVVAGGKSPDVILYEFFDYNCPWCKKSAPDIDRLVKSDKDFSLRLVQNPILSLGSVQASKIVLAAQTVAGNAPAYELHRALLARRGQVTGPDALEALKTLGLDAKKIEDRADSEDILVMLKRQAGAARALGMEATPSSAVNGMGLGGWPGAATLAQLVKNVRACDAISC